METYIHILRLETDMDWMFRSLMWIPNSHYTPKTQCDGIWRWDHWKIITFRRTSMMELVFFFSPPLPLPPPPSLPPSPSPFPLPLLLPLPLSWEGSHLQIRKRPLTRKLICWNLDFRFLRFQNCEKYISVV